MSRSISRFTFVLLFFSDSSSVFSKGSNTFVHVCIVVTDWLWLVLHRAGRRLLPQYSAKCMCSGRTSVSVKCLWGAKEAVIQSGPDTVFTHTCTNPSKRIGTARPVHLCLLYTEWDQTQNFKRWIEPLVDNTGHGLVSTRHPPHCIGRH